MSTLFELTDKVCVVIGATKGIGRATAGRMAEHGAKVVVTSRRLEDAQACAEELNREFGSDRAYGIQFDMRDRSFGPRLVDETMARWGRIDTLMCNAADIMLGRLEALGDDVELMSKSFESNVRNYAALTRHVAPVMKKQKCGSIIYVLSTAGFIAAPPYVPYAIAKAALGHLTKILAVDYGPHSITVNAIVPGAIATGTSGIQKSGGAELFVKKIPINRRGTPDEIAGMAVLLASPAGAYITGQAMVIDGGSLLKGSEGITEGYDYSANRWATEKDQAAVANEYYSLNKSDNEG